MTKQSKFKGRMTGLEPANDGITTRWRNHLPTPAYTT